MRLHEVAEYLGDFALFWPGVIVTLVVSVTLARPIARRLGSSRFVAALLVFGLGLIFSATVTPSREALVDGLLGTGTCDTSRIGFAPLSALLHIEDPAFNVLLFVPLGFALGMLPRSRPKLVLTILAFALSPVIELVQLRVTELDRACQTSDIFDNVMGLIIGLAVGVGVSTLVARSHRPRSAGR